MIPSARDEELILSAARSLLEHGRLEARWFLDFKSILNSVDQQPTAYWAPTYVRAVRLASLYLPLRYRSWSLASGQTDVETQRALAEVGRTAEVTLWEHALAAAETPKHEDDARICEHVFQSVEGLCTGRVSLPEWEHAYCRMIDAVSTRWYASSWWPRWPCMAVHFASFYLDVGLTQELPVAAQVSLSGQEEEVLERLGRLMNPTTLDIVRAWITSTGALRDGSGTPLLGKPKVGTRKAKVRTVSEVLLMRSRLAT